jgi:hypothetical protein
MLKAEAKKTYFNKHLGLPPSFYPVEQRRPNGRSRTILESIMLEFIFRPSALQQCPDQQNKY